MEATKINSKLEAQSERPAEPSERFRFYLQQELIRRCEKNSRYSLRAFAKVLGLEAPTLSHLLRGTRPISRKMMDRLSKSLGMGPEEMDQFANDVSRDALTLKLNQLTIDSFAVISDWYHFAILELTQLKHFQPDSKWISQRLGITPSEVNVAVERLVRLGFLETSPKKWKMTNSGNTTIGNNLTTVALRKLQKQYLEKSISSLEEVPLEYRDHTGVTLPISLKEMPAIKDFIKSFRKEFIRKFEKTVDAEEIYQVSISFFPLSQNRNKEKDT